METKESVYFLRLTGETNDLESKRLLVELIDKANQFKKTLSAIIAKSK